MEISLQEAINAARQMANHYRAFEKLHGVLLRTAEAEQLTSEAWRRVSDHEDQAARLREEIGRLEQRLIDEQIRLEAEVLRIRTAADGERERITLVVETLRREEAESKTKADQAGLALKANIDRLDAEYAARRNALESSFTERRDVLIAQVQDLESKIANLTEQLQSLRSRAMSL